MLTEKLKTIVNHFASLNPAFENKAFVLTDQSEFQGITDDYDIYVYARFLSQDGDRIYELMPFSDNSKGLYRAKFSFKIVISTKCCNPNILPIALQQFSRQQGVSIEAVGDNSEEIYFEETQKNLKREDVWLYALYGTWQGIYKVDPCLTQECINLADCGC